MSQENVEMVRRGWEAYEHGDLAAALATMSPEMVTHVAPRLPVAGTYHGPEGLLQLTLDWAESFDELVVTAEEFTDAGDQVVVRTLHKSRGAQSGAPVEADVWYVFTVHAGKSVRVDVFNDRSEALEAAGLSESDT
jgi:ketosteroid isomerase-like protein